MWGGGDDDGGESGDELRFKVVVAHVQTACTGDKVGDVGRAQVRVDQRRDNLGVLAQYVDQCRLGSQLSDRRLSDVYRGRLFKKPLRFLRDDSSCHSSTSVGRCPPPPSPNGFLSELSAACRVCCSIRQAERATARQDGDGHGDVDCDECQL